MLFTQAILDSIAVSVFVVLAKFYKYKQKQIQISSDGETSWLVLAIWQGLG